MLANNQTPNILTAAKYYAMSTMTLYQQVEIGQWIKGYLMSKSNETDVLLRLCNGLRFLTKKPMDVWEIKEVVIDRQYEKVKSVNEGDVVLDIGAGTGDFDVIADQAGAKVYAYDVDPERIRLLRLNLKLNQVKNVTAYTKEVKSIDELMEANKLSRCNFLKIDCEGAEYPIFMNTSESTFKKINFIAMEAHLFSLKMTRSFESLISRLSRMGFKIQIFNNDVHQNIKFVFAEKI